MPLRHYLRGGPGTPSGNITLLHAVAAEVVFERDLNTIRLIRRTRTHYSASVQKHKQVPSIAKPETIPNIQCCRSTVQAALSGLICWMMSCEAPSLLTAINGGSRWTQTICLEAVTPPLQLSFPFSPDMLAVELLLGDIPCTSKRARSAQSSREFYVAPSFTFRAGWAGKPVGSEIRCSRESMSVLRAD